MTDGAGVSGSDAATVKLRRVLSADSSVFARVRITAIHHVARVENDFVLAAIFLP